MKKLLPLIVILVVFSCKKEDINTNDPVNTGDVIIEQTVSTGDTTLASGNFSLHIPAGTFSSATVVSVTKSENSPFGGDAVSPVYFLNDLPLSTGQSMEITLGGIDLTHPPVLFLAEITRVPSLDTTAIVYRRIDYTVMDGRILVSIPRTPTQVFKSGSITDEKLTIGLVAAKSQETLTSASGHFHLTFPASKASEAEELAAYLEEAYSTFISPPFNFDYSNRTSWPMEISVLPLDNSIYGEQICSVWGDNFASLSFNSARLNEMAEMRITAGHEFFHFVQSLYDPRSSFMKAKFESDHYWLDEAMSAWSEELFTPNIGYASKTRTGNEAAPFEGGLNDPKADARGYGYGMSGMVKHIADHLGKDNLRKIYDQIRLGKKPGEAIRLGLNKFYHAWFGDMIEPYARGGIYSDVSTGLMVGLKSGQFDVKTDADSVMKFEASYPQLSSKVYVVSLKETALNDQSSLSVTADQIIDQVVHIYKFRSSTELPELVGSGSSQASVADIKTLVTGGYKFLVVTTSLNYSESNPSADNLSFTIKVSNQKLYKAFSLNLGVMCHYTYHYNSSGPNQVSGSWYTDGITEIPVTQSGNILTATWNGVYGSIPGSGTATITINENGTASITLHQDLDLGTAQRITDCVLTEVPLSTDDWYASTFFASESYPYIQSLYWKETYSSFYEEIDDYYLDPQYGSKSLTLRLFK